MLRTPCLFPARLTFLISGVMGKGGRKKEQACLSGTQPPLELASVTRGPSVSGAWAPQLPLSLWPLGGAQLSSLTTLASLWSYHHFFTSSDWDYSKGIWAGN